MDHPEKTNPPDPDSLAAEGEGGGDRRGLARRLERYSAGKARSRQMGGYVLQHRQRRLSERLYRCAQYLHFRQWTDHGNKLTLHEGRFCSIPLLCPVCAIRRGGKLLRRYVERANFLARSRDLFFVTLTVKNGPDLAERFDHLRGAVRKLRQRAKKGYGAMAVADGALWSYELTRSEQGWHPHVHMVWALPRGATVEGGAGSQLSADWHAITGDSFIVDARPIVGAVEEAFLEVVKYALKFSGLTLSDNYDAYCTLRGRRLVGSSGCWWGLDLPEDARLEDDDLDGPFIDLVYRYAGSQGYVPLVMTDGVAGTSRVPLEAVHSGYDSLHQAQRSRQDHAHA